MSQTQTTGTSSAPTINKYFLDHPEMVLGIPTAESTQYAAQDYTVEPIEGADLAEQLHEAIQHIHGEYVERDSEENTVSDIMPADPDVRNYSYTLVDGNVYYREGGVMVRQDVSAAAAERIKGMMELRDCTRRLIELQTMDAGENEIAAEQRNLNKLYDTFTAKHGLISSRENKRAFDADSSYYLLCSLEILDEDGRLERKSDMFTKRTIQPHRPVEHTETAVEALAVSMNEKARVYLPYMARLCGKDKAEIAAELQGVIFRVPGTDRYVTADEYLSGDVCVKLREAKAAAESDAAFNINVEALRAAQPRELTASEIDVRLGATWIEPQYIKRFIDETFKPSFWASQSIKVHYSPVTGEWRVEGKSAVGASDVNAYSTYGTQRMNAYKILENTLNLRDVRVFDRVEDENGNEKRVLNSKETTLAQQKQQVIKDAFKDWLWKDADRRQTLVAKYNELFNSVKPREYDGSHLTFPGMNPELTLRKHQRDAIARVLYGGNTLLAHEVGAGKTFTMAAAAMEAKRLGLCSKSMFVVPNHLTEQWASEFLRLYPSANILVTTKKDFEKANRQKFCARIATGGYDAVIIGHSQFEKIPVSQERQEQLLHDQIDEITEGIRELKSSKAEIQMWVSLPEFIPENHKIPAVLYIHGGPTAAYVADYWHEFQVLTSSGIAVIYCNPRGSTGYGLAFASEEPAWGSEAVSDLLQSVDVACENFGCIDPERIGITGGSYGGYMTVKLAATTKRFRAAIGQRVLCNPATSYGTGDMGFYSASMNPNEIDIGEILRGRAKRSLLTHIDDVDIPFLILHGFRDYRCSFEQAEQLFSALKDRKPDLPVRMVMFPAGNHGVSRDGRPCDMIRHIDEMNRWFTKYLSKEVVNCD